LRLAALVFGQGADLDVDGAALALAQDRHRHRLADVDPAHHGRQRGGILDLFAVELEDDVAGLDAGAGGGAVRYDVGDQRAHRLVEAEGFGQAAVDGLDGDTEIAALDFAARLELFNDVHGRIDGHGERQAHVAARAAEDLRIDADHFALAVEQRPARVARVDRDIGLDEGRVGVIRQVAVERTHDALRRRVIEPERRADGEDPLADLEFIGIAQVGRRQALGVDLEQTDVAGFVGAQDLSHVFTVVVEFDHDLVGLRHDVGVGQHKAVGRQDQPRAERLALARLARIAALEALEEFAERAVFRQAFHQAIGDAAAVLHRLRRGNVDDRVAVVVHDPRKVRHLARRRRGRYGCAQAQRTDRERGAQHP